MKILTQITYLCQDFYKEAWESNRNWNLDLTGIDSEYMLNQLG